MIRITKTSPFPSGGRSPSVTKGLTPQKTQYAADAVLRRGLSTEAWQTLDQLYVSGIMTIEQISLARRTLRNYARERLITRYTYPVQEVVRQLGERFLPVEDGQLYTLGPVGVEILTTRHGIRPTQRYLAYPFERVLPALILNEIIQRIETEAIKYDWTLRRYSPEQAQLMKNEKVIFSPSALISLEQGEHIIFFALEYHDEEHSRGAWRKVLHYEDASESRLWEEKWLGENFPLVLAVFWHSRVGEGYSKAISEMRAVNTSFYGRNLEGLLQAGGMDAWVNIEKGDRENVFPWLE
ncbi:MAG: hypothetical protein HN855_11725 [Anaerolineae bacterium]|jgi:hypothetical protein|nr:hypothetical protein [Anaerolineae bacterium]MBT7190106.1 hypothetical protein [Anaerolineae bacterium]MBT7325822.1 hypothetical protein [Anaerolineae bacterium]